MAVYIDNVCIVDTEKIIFSTPFNGREEYDGCYFIIFIIETGHESIDTTVKYPTENDRDEAFLAICLLIKADEYYDVNESGDV